MTVGDISAASSAVVPSGAAPALQLPVRDVGSGAAEAAGTGTYSWSGDRLAPVRDAESGTPAVSDLLHAAFTVLLHRYSGQDDIVGARAGGAGGAPLRRPVAVRSRIAEDVTLSALAVCLGARYRDAARNTAPDAPADLGTGLRAGYVEHDGTQAVAADGFALLLEAELTAAAMRLTLHYDHGLFAGELITRMAANLGTLLRDAAARPEAPVGELTVLSAAETHHLLSGLNDTVRPYASTPLHALVEAQAARTPDAPAVEWQGAVLTYRQLDEQANRLARALASGGITPGSRVGLCLARTHRTVVLLLAVHKAGCAYVPLDPAYPADRLSAIAATADMAAVVHDGDDAPGWLDGVAAASLPWTELWEKASAEDGGPLETGVDPGATTHLIYTSGSTGLPKGVVISHRNVVALLAWAEDTYGSDELARVLFSTSLNFDLSVFELWAPLTRGGCVVVVDNVLALTEDEELRPTLVNTVPSALNVLLQRAAVPASTRVLNVAGEPLSKELVNAAFDGTGIERLYNLYGPSEDTTYSTWKCFTGPTAAAPTVGVPIHNTVAHLLDAHGRLVPHGATGELHLGGDGLAQGYINDPERTAAAFVPAPAHLAVPGGRLYRTGDLARWTEDGELRFLGRRDNQVKVRGFRIELGEIESVMRETAGLRDVAALAVRTDGDTRLVCYVGQDGGTVSVEAMSAHLRAKLPHYMQPAKIIVEERLPRLPNGKVDRTSLAARDIDWGQAAEAAFMGDDPDEIAVARVWSDLLGLVTLSSDLDFFSVGGHSLLANLLAARLSDIAARPVRVAEIYEYRTLADQAALLRRKRAQLPDAQAGAGTAGRLRAVAETLRESGRGHGVPGAGVAVFLDGALEFTYHGVADTGTGAAYGAGTRQRVTCITKPMLAFVALRLVDRGLVGLDQPLHELLPQAFRRRDGGTVQVTLRHLLSHTSGVDDSYEVWHDTDLPGLDAYIGTLAGYGQLFEPGEVFAYSAVGTSIVAALIEKLLGMPWRRAVNELILAPLGIEEIPQTLTEDGHYGGAVSVGYVWNERAKSYLRHDPPRQTVADDAAGSFSVCLTLEELAKIALLAIDDGVAPSGERLLSAHLAEQMRTPQIPVPGHHFMHAWGLGWLMFGPSAFGFNSNGSGHHNFIQIFPEERTFLLLLANAYPAFGLYEDLLRALTGEGLIRTGRPFTQQLDDCAGLYACDGYRLNVLRGTGHLRYEYAERRPDGTWLQLDEGDLVLSGAGGFSSMSEKNILAGSISFIPTPGTDIPGYVRIGQRFARKTR
ncbi:amino acid adenylation domain-containing protein [Streptomyces sp. V4I23]|uniref:non-ribosomal peptide synthetase n=1 Tax=Streptomyces sp. V4I23 TaxID=3042282 RepID=UPI0027841B8E|nr:amino acid adenylation domain-containing protein [Streptomyces sp. V4I23]MDQ1012798.1 amino acid adenylation domain-containing protein [Streptomyces sp. V4I23]